MSRRVDPELLALAADLAIEVRALRSEVAQLRRVVAIAPGAVLAASNFHVVAGYFALAVACGLADESDRADFLVRFDGDPEAARRAVFP